MATIGSISLLLSANTAKFNTALDAAGDKLKSFEKSTLSFKGILGGLGASLAAAFTINAFKGWVKEGLDAIDTLNDMAIKLGTTTEKLSGLQYAAKLAGSNGEELVAVLNKMNIALGKSGDE